MSYQLGQQAGYEAIGHGQPLRPLFNEALGARHTAPGAALLSGLLEVMCSVLDACQRQGIRFDISDEAKAIANALPQARRLMVVTLCQHIDQSVADVLGHLSGAIFAIKDSLSLSAPPAVNPEQPVMRMEIVAMPERSTTQTITRRENGDLIGAVSSERDTEQDA